MNTEAIANALDHEPTKIKLKGVWYNADRSPHWDVLAEAKNADGLFSIELLVPATPKALERKWLIRSRLTVARLQPRSRQVEEVAGFFGGQKLSGRGADAAAAEFAAHIGLDLTKMRLKLSPAWTLLFLQAKAEAEQEKLYAARLEHARKVAITLGNEVHRLRGEKPYDEIHALLYNP